MIQGMMNSPYKQKGGNGNVKISIVNVHNQFNIHNNIIINGQPTEDASFFGMPKQQVDSRTFYNV